MSRIYVEAYRELECFSTAVLDHVAAVVAREKCHDTACAAIARIIPGRDDGVSVLTAVLTVVDSFYSAMAEWLGIDPGEHYICLDAGSERRDDPDVDVDVRGVETTDGKSVDMVILHPILFVIDKNGDRDLDISSLIKRAVQLMIYIDIHARGEIPVQENADDAYISGIIDASAEDVIKYAREISGLK